MKFKIAKTGIEGLVKVFAGNNDVIENDVLYVGEFDPTKTFNLSSKLYDIGLEQTPVICRVVNDKKFSRAVKEYQDTTSVPTTEEQEFWYVYFIKTQQINFMMVLSDGALPYQKHYADFATRDKALEFIKEYTHYATHSSIDVYPVTTHTDIWFTKCDYITYSKSPGLRFYHKCDCDFYHDIILDETLYQIENISVGTTSFDACTNTDVLHIASVISGEHITNVDKIYSNDKISWHAKQALSIMIKYNIRIDNIVMRRTPDDKIASNCNNFLSEMIRSCPSKYKYNYPNPVDFKAWIEDKYADIIRTKSNFADVRKRASRTYIDTEFGHLTVEQPTKIQNGNGNKINNASFSGGIAPLTLKEWLGNLEYSNIKFLGVVESLDDDEIDLESVTGFAYIIYKDMIVASYDILHINTFSYDLKHLLYNYNKSFRSATMCINALFAEYKKLKGVR
jgi:hypothetical protein